MKCPQRIVISIIYSDKQYDIEVPTDAKIVDIKNSIVSTLNAYFKQGDSNVIIDSTIKLLYGDTELDNEKILGNYGIWDGSTIIVR